MDLKEELKVLVATVKDLALQEHKSGDWISTDSDTYGYFKEFSIKRKKQTTSEQPHSQKPLPKQAPSPQLVTPNSTKPAFTPSVKTSNTAVEQRFSDQHKSDQHKSGQHQLKQHQSPVTPSKEADNLAIEAPETLEVQASDKPKQHKTDAFELQPLSAPTEPDLSDLKKIVTQINSDFAILDHIPVSSPEIIIVSDDMKPKHQAFLNNLSKAIELLVGPAAIFSTATCDQAMDNPKLRLIISDNHELKTKTAHLQLLPINHYLSQPSAKAALWSQIIKLKNAS